MRRSLALRGAALAGLVVLVGALGAAYAVWRGAEAALRTQSDRALAAEAEGLVREFELFGAAGLAEGVAGITRRRGLVYVFLQGPDGSPIAGNLRAAAPPLLRGFATLERPGAGPLRALGATLPGGLNLVVATELAPVQDAAAALAWTPPLAALPAAAAALLLGFIAARRLEARLARAGEAARAIMDGDLSRRLPGASDGDGDGDELDRLSGTINLLLARLEALVAAQRSVTDDIAHDLRTPLSRLRTRLEAALAAPRDPGADDAMLAAAVAELDGVLATFAALLRIARTESGAGRNAFVPVDLSALVSGMADTYGPAVEEAGRPWSTVVAPGVTLPGDAALLRQAVANLLDNALLHGAGAVSLSLEPGPVIAVSDEGPGIPTGEREAVTRRFHRLDRSRTTPGTGLGLALVAATAALHGGAFRIEDGPGRRGTRAVLDLRVG